MDEDILELVDCPICNDSRYKQIINTLLLQNIAYESIHKYLYEKQGVRIALSDIKFHKENHFKVREQRAFRFVEKQDEMREIFEKYKKGQQESIHLIDTLNMTMKQMITRFEEMMTDPQKGIHHEKLILGYLKEIRMTAESLAKLKGDLETDNNVNVHVINHETEHIVEIIGKILDELSPEMKDQFFLKLNEKLEEAGDEKP